MRDVAEHIQEKLKRARSHIEQADHLIDGFLGEYPDREMADYDSKAADMNPRYSRVQNADGTRSSSKF